MNSTADTYQCQQDAQLVAGSLKDALQAVAVPGTLQSTSGIAAPLAVPSVPGKRHRQLDWWQDATGAWRAAHVIGTPEDALRDAWTAGRDAAAAACEVAVEDAMKVLGSVGKAGAAIAARYARELTL